MKYKATITVEYEVEVEDLIGVTQVDVKNYIDCIQDSYFDGIEEIHNVETMILAELENAIKVNIPTSTPNTNKALKIKPKIEVVDFDIETIS